MAAEASSLAYYTYRPRPDQPARYDQQHSFYYSQHPGVTFLVGGNGAGTTSTSLAKVAKFVLSEQPPPRRDCPFWIIAGSYEQVMESCWKEKLSPVYGHGHIPGCEIDWERIRWYKPNDHWPFRVPLKPWPGRPGRNWTLEFKSYEQGRAQMQARSLGGFCFVEQFPWGILEEVLRGCREYSFVGAKLAEFTPIDPALSAPLEEMIEEDKLPEGWAIYRASTACAVEAGHVSQQWYDEFFGMISEEMRPVREIGAFASFEGQIYQRFNPAIHIVDPDDIEYPSGAHYFRAIDWGAGPDNAFCCLWGYKTGIGEWVIFDEYYSTEQCTVHEHLKRVADRHEWPATSNFYGTTYADPSDPGNLRIAAKLSHYCPGYDNFNMSSAINRVLEGIDYVRWLLQVNPATGRPRMTISKDCKNLKKQMKTYRWRAGSEAGRNPTDARAEPLKKEDHAVDALRYLVFSEATVTGTTPESMAKIREQNHRGVRLDRGER